MPTFAPFPGLRLTKSAAIPWGVLQGIAAYGTPDSLGGYYRELLPTAAIPWGVLNKEKPGYPPTGG